MDTTHETTPALIIESGPLPPGDAGPMLTPALIEYPNLDGPEGDAPGIVAHEFDTRLAALLDAADVRAKPAARWLVIGPKDDPRGWGMVGYARIGEVAFRLMLPLEQDRLILAHASGSGYIDLHLLPEPVHGFTLADRPIRLPIERDFANTAWHLLCDARHAVSTNPDPVHGPFDVDEWLRG